MTAARTPPAPPVEAAPDGPAPSEPAGTQAGPPASRSEDSGEAVWRRWRVPLALVAVVLLGGAVIALLQRSTTVSGYLDPADTSATGTHALADILAGRGYTVIREVTPAAAESAADQGDATLVITSPQLLTNSQLAALSRVRADLVLVQPDGTTLGAFAPGATVVAAAGSQSLPPDCDLPAARQAGWADMGGLAMAPAAGQAATRCYPVAGGASLLQYRSGGRVITLLGVATPLTNGSLADQGNAALALNLLAARQRIVWLVPIPADQVGGAGSGQQSASSLVPLAAYLIAIQLGIAAVLAALWRARRLGPLIAEPLPVVVRASETAEGLAGLYRSRRARDRAAAALRTARLARTLPVLGLAPSTGPGEVISAVSARSGSAEPSVTAMLFGPAPADDAALVALADDLDALERKVRGQ
jgi:hypothetical protein